MADHVAQQKNASKYKGHKMKALNEQLVPTDAT
jgi:hypothetical protein